MELRPIVFNSDDYKVRPSVNDLPTDKLTTISEMFGTKVFHVKRDLGEAMTLGGGLSFDSIMKELISIFRIRDVIKELNNQTDKIIKMRIGENEQEAETVTGSLTDQKSQNFDISLWKSADDIVHINMHDKQTNDPQGCDLSFTAKLNDAQQLELLSLDKVEYYGYGGECRTKQISLLNKAEIPGISRRIRPDSQKVIMLSAGRSANCSDNALEFITDNNERITNIIE